jgi:hypothetical protein
VPLLLFASCLPTGCYVASRSASVALRHLLSRCRLTCKSSTPSCHTGDSTSCACHSFSPQLVVVMSLVEPPQSSLPPLSTPQPSSASSEERGGSTHRKAPAAEADSGCRAGVKRLLLHLQWRATGAVLTERSSVDLTCRSVF